MKKVPGISHGEQDWRQHQQNGGRESPRCYLPAGTYHDESPPVEPQLARRLRLEIPDGLTQAQAESYLISTLYGAQTLAHCVFPEMCICNKMRLRRAHELSSGFGEPFFGVVDSQYTYSMSDLSLISSISSPSGISIASTVLVSQPQPQLTTPRTADKIKRAEIKQRRILADEHREEVLGLETGPYVDPQLDRSKQQESPRVEEVSTMLNNLYLNRTLGNQAVFFPTPSLVTSFNPALNQSTAEEEKSPSPTSPLYSDATTIAAVSSSNGSPNSLDSDRGSPTVKMATSISGAAVSPPKTKVFPITIPGHANGPHSISKRRRKGDSNSSENRPLDSVSSTQSRGNQSSSNSKGRNHARGNKDKDTDYRHQEQAWYFANRGKQNYNCGQARQLANNANPNQQTRSNYRNGTVPHKRRNGCIQIQDPHVAISTLDYDYEKLNENPADNIDIDPTIWRKQLDELREDLLGVITDEPYYDRSLDYDNLKNKNKNTENIDPLEKIRADMASSASATCLRPEIRGYGINTLLLPDEATKPSVNLAAADQPVLPLEAEIVAPEPVIVDKGHKLRQRKDEEREDLLGVQPSRPYFDREYLYNYDKQTQQLI